MKEEAQALLHRDEVALVVVDIQERLLPAIANRGALLANVIRLARFAKQIGTPVVASQQIKLGPLAPEILAALPDLDIVEKAEFGALRSAAFAERLAALRRQTLVVVGIETHICVTQTVLDALPRYRVHVIADAVGSRTVDNWRIGLSRMQSAGAVVSSTEMLIYELLERAGTEEFRAALEIVKNG